MKSIKKKVFGLVASIAMVLSLFVLPVSVNAATGDGTKENPYMISNVNDLKQLDQSEKYIYAKLANNIDLSQEIPSTGYYLKNFRGELDGNGHQIKNLPSQKHLIHDYYAGDLRNFDLVLNVSTLGDGDTYTGLVYEQVNIQEEHKYTNITLSGNVEVGSNNNNESPLVIYAAGDTTMDSIHINLDYTSSTYNGLFVGYEPYKESTYTFRNCSVSGKYIAQHIGILFGNGSMSSTSDYGLQHVNGIEFAGVKPTSTISVENLNLTSANILGIDSQPHLLCGVSYNTEKFDSLESELSTKSEGYDQLQKASSLEDASFQLNTNNELKITNNNDSIGAFEVISEVYSNVFTSNGIANGTLKHSVSERINVEDGINTYYSSLGKVKFYDGSNGVYGTTGIDGKTKTITVGNETYYTLQPSTNGDIYTFGQTAEVSDTARISNVRVLVYDKAGDLINIVNGPESSVFEKPNLQVTVDANTTLENVSLDNGWTWTEPQTKVIVGGQIAFAKKDKEMAPVYIEGKSVPANKVNLSLETVNLEVGDTVTLKATVDPENTTDQLAWSSSNNTVATVDENGKVTAVGAGKATITAKAGNQTATCEVTVYEVDSNISAPTIDTSKPVDSVTVGINDEESQKNISDTLTSIVDNIANEKEVTSVNQETAKKIKQAIDDGKVVSTEVQVKPVEASQVDAQDKKVIEDHIDENVNIAQYLDINILVKADNQVIGEINQLNKKITFTVAIPEDLMKEGRTFYVIRVHDGKAEKLDTVENEDGTLTFKTDKFSTYALAYEDAQESTTTPTTPNQPNNPEQPTQPGQSQDDIKGEAVVTPDNNQQVTNTQNTQETAKEPKTGDTSNIALYGAMALISLGLVGAVVLKKKISEK